MVVCTSRGGAMSCSQGLLLQPGIRGNLKAPEVAVSEGKKSNRLLFLRGRGRRWGWRNNDRDFPPALYEFFPSGLGNALMQASENINRLFENMNLTPWSLSGCVKEKDDHYKLRYEMPGIAKEDVKITIDDGVLRIKGEHKEEKEEGDDDEYWSSSSYGYYNTSLVLPDDARADDIKAELKDGVLTVTIPRTENLKKDVKQVTLQ
ncbi:26.5 kDa heat shock protein [Spatholobus suberectus]|nr:26.5 kDa heat shock protein [Spatholobus suberectus]